MFNSELTFITFWKLGTESSVPVKKVILIFNFNPIQFLTLICLFILISLKIRGQKIENRTGSFISNWISFWSTKGLLKCIWHEIFYSLIRKSFQNDEEWCLFYCDSTFGCRPLFIVIALLVADHHKTWNISEDFFYIELKLCTVVATSTKFHDISPVTFSWQHNGLQALSIQKIKSEFFSFKKCYLLLLFIQWVWGNMDITQHKHKKVR